MLGFTISTSISRPDSLIVTTVHESGDVSFFVSADEAQRLIEELQNGLTALNQAERPAEAAA